MTATAHRAAHRPPERPGRTPRPDRAERPNPEPRNDRSAARRTLLALLASALSVVPLQSLFTDPGWLIDVWLSMIVVIGPAALMRLRRPPGALDIWPGVVLLIPWLTLRFVPTHSWLGLIPTGATVHDVRTLMDSLHHTTSDEAAPIHTTVAVRLVLCALLGLLAALIDLIAVVGRRGALAGVPMLVVYTVSGAVPRQPVSWLWFTIAAVGFLLLLALDADDELHRWGRRIPRRGNPTTGSRLVIPISAQRVGIVAILAAVVLPLLVPAQSRNLISDLFHNGGIGGSGDGEGSGTGGISPFATLKGDLTRDRPVDLLDVHVNDWTSSNKPPFYLRTTVLDTFTGKGWIIGDADQPSSQENDSNDQLPIGSTKTSAYSARLQISGLNGTPPVFAHATRLDGLGFDAELKPEFQVVQGTKSVRGLTYTESFTEARPSDADLAKADAPLDVTESPWLKLPSVPSSVATLVNRLTAGKSTPYAQARAISDYFANPANGFAYSLKTKTGDSGNDLVDFLKNKIGYCQQYAAAMAVMLRQTGIPSRVVLGYMHPIPDKSGDFTVTTLDAHAWVEAYFTGIGWLPFDPTPVDGLDGGSQSDISYAPHVYPSGANDRISKTQSSNAPVSGASSSAAASKAAAASTNGRTTSTNLSGLWTGIVVLVVLVIGLTPAGLRLVRRRRRIAASRGGDPDPLWDELSDTAVDLGYVWSPARSPRQVADWLARDAQEPAALDALAVAVEHRRYSANADSPDTAELARGLQSITSNLRAGRTVATRLRAVLWPASLGLGQRLRGRLGRRGQSRRAQSGDSGWTDSGPAERRH